MKTAVMGMALAGMFGLSGLSTELKAATWSNQDYDFYTGDFNGDGNADVLYIAKAAARESGIALSSPDSATILHQSWSSNYLGLPWSGNTLKPLIADFNGDGYADLLLQGTAGGDSHLLLMGSDARISAIAQSIPGAWLGLGWSNDQHQLIAGDFNGDGRSDLLLQAVSASGVHAIELADSEGQFTQPARQIWNEGYLGLNWSAANALVYAGDFNGDDLTDLLSQVRVDEASPAASATALNGVVLAQNLDPVFDFAGLQTWGQDGLGADWSSLNSEVLVGDFNGDGRTDVLLRAREPGANSMLLNGADQGPALVAAQGPVRPNSPLLREGGLQLIREVARLAAASHKNLNASGSTASRTASTQMAPASTSSRLSGGGASVMSLVTPTVAGRTPGSFSVSDNGAANYSIPIVVPPGIAGVQPNLAITYDSNRGNGLLGIGWGLSGLSTIYRCEKTLVQDNSTDRVLLTNADLFCLDGNKLRLTSGTYGANASTYQTEIETYSRVTAVGSAGNGPANFVMEAKDGLIYEYGNSSDSRIESLASGYTTTPRTWALTSVRDRSGNTMTFTYVEDGAPNGSYRPNEIAYTSNSAAGVSAGAYKVKFVWEDRPSTDIISNYFAGGKIRETKRLTRIETQYNGGSGFALVRKYELNYNANGAGGRSRIDGIQECDGGGNCLAPTTVSWQDGSPGFGAEMSTGINVSPYPLYPILLDFNNDGRIDLMFANGSTWSYALGNGSGFSSVTSTSVSHGSKYDMALTTDLDGNGATDLLYPALNIGNYWWTAMEWTGSGFASLLVPVLSPSMANQAWVTDFNGDGLDDLIYTNSTRNVLYGSANVGGTLGSSTTLYTPPFPWEINWTGNMPWYGSPMAKADFDGDGRNDFLSAQRHVCVDENGDYYDCQRSPLLSSNGGTYTETEVIVNDQAFVNSSRLALDLNGDARSDLVYVCQTFGTDWCYRFGTGAGIGGQNTYSAPAAFALMGEIALDWDGDGREDLMYGHNTGGNMQVLRSTGEGFLSPMDAGIGVLFRFYLGNVNDDGVPDLLYVDGSNILKYRLHNGNLVDVVTGITDGFGNNVSLTYARLSDSSAYTGPDTAATFPEADLKVVGPNKVVKQASVTDGVGGTYTLTYMYKGGKTHRTGRGFLGFSSRTATDSRTNVKTTWNYRQDFPYIGAVSSMTVKQSNGNTIQQVTNTWTTLSAGAAWQERNFPYASVSTKTVYELDGAAVVENKTTTTIGSGDYGVPSTVQVETRDVTGTSMLKRTLTTSNSFAPHDTANWCVGFITQQATTSTVPSLAAQTRTVEFVKDPAAAKCRVQQQIIEPSLSAHTVTTTFGFDAFGNVNSQTVSATDITNRVSTLNYGATGVFPVWITNAEGHVTDLTWNYALGVPLTVQDPNDLTTTFQYDGFGRRTKAIRPDLTRTDWTLSACNSGNSYCGQGNSVLRYQIQAQEFDSALGLVHDAYQRFDSFDRVKYDGAQSLTGSYSVIETRYDNLGRVSQQSAPYFAGSTAYFSAFTYDLLNRPTKEERPIKDDNPTLQNTQFGYDKLTHTQTDANGKVTTKYLNALGQTVQMKDAANSLTNYVYDPFGNLLTVTDSAGNVITNTYNIRGLKLTSSDPDMGNWSYTYFRTGELNTQTDAKSQVATFTYDRLSRPLTRVELEGTTTWVWGTSLAAKNIGQLECVNQAATTSCSSAVSTYRDAYTYDSLGRLATATSRIDSTNYTYTYAYDATTGLLDSLQYPASTGTAFKVKYDYQNGQLKRIKDFYTPANVAWEALATNPRGQLSQDVTGGQLVTNRDYDLVTGLVDTIQTGLGGAGTGEQNLTFTWDKVGNLKTRADLYLAAMNEAYTYDSLNRLDLVQKNGATTQNPTFNAIGNITSKVDGSTTTTYTYTGSQTGCSYYTHTQPHAVRKTTVGSTNTIYCYDANGNMTKRAGRNITWFSYNLPNRIDGPNSKYAQFYYTPDRQRYKQVHHAWSDASVLRTTRYVGDLFEKVDETDGGVSSTIYRHYIMVEGRRVVSHLRYTEPGYSYTWNSGFLHDHLGSVTADYPDDELTAYLYSYDAFGKRRGDDWTGVPLAADLDAAWFDSSSRGFTDHEHLDNANGLIHMNGRVYDPAIGRFISADPYVQAPYNLQSLNRYSYVFNNPLSYTDPTGFSTNCYYTTNPNCLADVYGEYINDLINGVVNGTSASGPATAGTAPVVPRLDNIPALQQPLVPASTTPIIGSTVGGGGSNDSPPFNTVPSGPLLTNALINGPRLRGLYVEGNILRGTVPVTCVNFTAIGNCGTTIAQMATFNHVDEDGYGIQLTIRPATFLDRFNDNVQIVSVTFWAPSSEKNGSELNQHIALFGNKFPTTAPHELGHVLGLGHNTLDRRSVMWQYSIPGRLSRPSSADIRTLVEYYRRRDDE